MKQLIIIAAFLLLILFGGAIFFISQPNLNISNSTLGVATFGNNEQIEKNDSSQINENTKLIEASNSALLQMPTYMAQRFNNCGPANLAMILNYWGGNYTQEKLASDLRPFNTVDGGVDDKSVFNDEMAKYAQQSGFKALVRPNGDIEKIKLLTTNGIPVLVSAWLKPNEDIGHYRLVKGFDESKKIIITDDSYIGQNKTFSYTEFVELWKPFNYTYLIIYPEEKSTIVNQILAEETDQNIAYQNAIKKAQADLAKNPNDFYATFNIATANYYLGNFAESARLYEAVEVKLPARMLWYQYEPILSYQQIGEDQKAIAAADHLLNNANLAFSEMYQLKGEIYLKQGNKNLAKQMFEQALYYNKNYDKPKESLKISF